MWEALGINAAGSPPAVNDPDIAVARVPDLADELAELRDDTLTESELAAVDSALGTTTAISLDPKARLIPHAADSVVAEHYRRLRTAIMQERAEGHFGSLVVTSAGPQEGKTVTVLNLGLSFAMLPSFKVLVVDGDMRRGTLGNWLGVDQQHPGLSNLIDGSVQLDEIVLKSDEVPMHFMVRGNTQVPDLEASQLTTHFHALTEQYDLVLVDSPPVNLIADVQLLAASCDAVLLVARAFSTTQKAFEQTVRDLSRFRVIGTVLNAGTGARYRYRGGYY